MLRRRTNILRALIQAALQCFHLVFEIVDAFLQLADIILNRWWGDLPRHVAERQGPEDLVGASWR